DPESKIGTLARKYGSICPGAKPVDDLLAGVRSALGVRAKRLVDDRRMRREIRDALHDLRKRQLVGPDEAQPTPKSCELGLVLRAHEATGGSRPGHHENLPGVGEHAENVVDEEAQVGDDRHRSLGLAKWSAQIPLIQRGEDERLLRKKLLSVLACEDSRRATDRHDEIR